MSLNNLGHNYCDLQITNYKHMATSVIARQSGDDFQSKFFWLKACGLNHSHTCIKKVAWEMDCTFGFDDVVVYYDPAAKESGYDVTEDYYQVKFHVDHKRGFTCEALMDPEFIGNKTESILQRLHNNYKKDPNTFALKRYNIVNTWGLDRNDDLPRLLGNNGGIRLDVLFKNGPKSANGKIREAWKAHLEIDSDEKLREILAPLRIMHSFGDERQVKDQLNTNLVLSGLRPIPADQHSSKYNDLIQKLHASGRNVFTKDELLEILKAEDLYVGKTAEEDFFKVGVRSFRKGAENLENEVDQISCFLHCFSSRFILEEYAGMEFINEQIKATAEKIIVNKKPVLLHLDTHLSLATLLGSQLNPKYGVPEITLVQKTFNGKKLWKADAETTPVQTAPFWTITEEQLNEQGDETVLSINVTHNIIEDVNAFVEENLAHVKARVHASLLPKIGATSLIDANHAVSALEELISTMKTVKRKSQAMGKVHVFIAAPNAMAFYLGQKISLLGKVALYEFDFEQQRNGGYHAILEI
ncbi:hypothetical protein BAY13_15940 [Elizabethkingia bruuniana]|nr:hypothetical protein BAY13_15940 [Elizabethkingia bruuniana]